MVASPWRTSIRPAADDTLERLAHGRPGHPEHLRKAALAGQRLPRLHLAAEHVGKDLLEDIFGYRTPVDRLQCHGPTMTDQRPEVKWSDQLPSTTSQVIASGYLRGHR